MAGLLVVDMSAVFHRAWHGTAAGERSLLPDGRSFHAVHASVQIIIQAIRRNAPADVLIAAEAPGANAGRRALSPAYKAHRPPPDLDLVAQMRDTWSVLAAAGFAVVGLFRHEADDVAASAAAEYPGQVRILTGDRDLLALCTERVAVDLFRRGGSATEVCGPAECRKILGVDPAQVCEFKALAGDASDGIPGVNGIGPKSAQKILAHYGTVRAAYDDALLIGVPPPARRAFREGREAAQMSYRLARLEASLPVAGRWRPLTSAFGDQAVDTVSRLGFAETARLFQRLPKS